MTTVLLVAHGDSCIVKSDVSEWWLTNRFSQEISNGEALFAISEQDGETFNMFSHREEVKRPQR